MTQEVSGKTLDEIGIMLVAASKQVKDTRSLEDRFNYALWLSSFPVGQLPKRGIRR
jgi:hypothetical protein